MPDRVRLELLDLVAEQLARPTRNAGLGAASARLTARDPWRGQAEIRLA
jgi:hypothetical protein